MFFLFALKTATSLWLIPVIAIIAALLAFTYYYYQKVFIGNKKWILITLRSLGIFGLLFLLLQPLLYFQNQKKQKPVLLLYTDNSASAKKLINLAAITTDLKSKLNFELLTFLFAEEVKNQTDTLLGKQTNLQKVNQHIAALKKDNNIAAALVITDGIITSGANPAVIKSTIPVFTLGVGNPQIIPDLVVSDVVANKSVFVGNQTTIQATIKAIQAKGLNLRISLQENGAILQTKTLLSDQNFDEKRVEFIVNPSQPGKHFYTIVCANLPAETYIANNKKTCAILAITNEKVIQLIAHAPHPDIAAIKNALKLEKTFKISMGNINNPINTSHAYVLHGIPQTANEIAFLQKLQTANVPYWLIASVQTAVNKWNNTTLQISYSNGLSNEVQAAENATFNAFYTEPSLLAIIKKLPVLQAPYVKVSHQGQALFTQKIQSVATNNPLWLFTQNTNQRQSYLFAEGLWRWALSEFKNTGNKNATNAFILKTVQYISNGISQNGFTTAASNTVYQASDNVTILAEFTDETGNLINPYSVNTVLKSENGNERKINLSPYLNSYRSSIGSLPPGKYTFTSTLSTKNLVDKGEFLVENTDLESQITQANHSLLKAWSNNTGGVFSTNMVDIIASINKNISKQVFLINQNKTASFLTLWPYLIGLILIFTLEWVLRKYWGSY